MFCRKCGSKIKDTAKFCDVCGEKVVIVKQRTDVQKYDDYKEKENSKKTKRELKLEKLKNPYIIPAFATAIIAFGLGIFPWPRSWGIGTSLWMKIIILLVALLSDYHCTKAKQINRMYEIQYRFKVKPKILKTATILASLTTIVALFALITM